MSTHLPFMWRFRLLRALRAKGNSENRRLLGAWQRAEGGTARWNPLNTTEHWTGSWPYNSAGVQNYRTGTDGLRATAATLVNGRYDGIVSDLRTGTKSARQIVLDRRAEISTWGTNPDTIISLL